MDRMTVIMWMSRIAHQYAEADSDGERETLMDKWENVASVAESVGLTHADTRLIWLNNVTQ